MDKANDLEKTWQLLKSRQNTSHFQCCALVLFLSLKQPKQTDANIDKVMAKNIGTLGKYDQMLIFWSFIKKKSQKSNPSLDNQNLKWGGNIIMK